MYSWNSPPVWTFGSGIRGDEQKQSTSYYTPGPGTYEETDDNNYKQAYPQWKVGTSHRPDLYSSWNKKIGPGSYEVSKKATPVETDKARSTFSRAEKKNSKATKNSNPVGPGSYFPKKSTEAPPAFSFGYKSDGFQLASNAEFPGPGTYEIKNIIDEAFQKSMRPPGSRSAFTRTAPHALTGSIEPEGVKPLTPGPGHHYNAEIETFDLRYFQPTWSFGKSTRDALYNDETKQFPGPGNYPMQTVLKTKGGFTILGKNQKKGNANDTPAPNVYKQDIAVLRKTAPSFRIGKAERRNMAMGNCESPGPGAYHREATPSTKGLSMEPIKKRQFDTGELKKSPGPGQYEIEGTIGNNTKYSMGIKGGAKKSTELVPGPGEYEPYSSVYLEKNIGAIIGTSERPPLYKRGGAPGPGQYDVRKDIGGSKCKIGTGKRVSTAKNYDEPGPGFYNIPSAIGNIPKYLRAGFAQERRKSVAEKESSVRGL